MAKRVSLKRSRKQLLGRKITSRRNISRLQTGGEKINLINILLTQSIIDAIKERRPGFDAKAEGFKMLPKERPAGFKLSRMDQMMQANISALVKEQPVELTAISKHKEYGTLYDILNGRHRVARSIIDRLSTINAKII